MPRTHLYLPGPSGVRQWRGWTFSVKAVAGNRLVAILILLIGLVSLLLRMKERPRYIITSQNLEHELWSTAPSLGWQASCVSRSLGWFPPRKSIGYLLVRCNGGLNQQRSAICNAVLAARIMNATLVLPHLGTSSVWYNESGFPGIYDVNHFITSLRNDIRVVRSLPTTWVIGGEKKTLKPFQLYPPRDAPVGWYETTALEKMQQHGAVYLTPFSQSLTEELENQEYQRLRCRVNNHALRFTDEVRNLSSLIVERLRSEGPYMSLHLEYELDKCWHMQDIFTLKEHLPRKDLKYSRGRQIGKCPLSPAEVGLLLHAMGFDNSTLIYLSAGEIFGGQSFLEPLQALFPRLVTRSTVATTDELALVSAEGYGLLGPVIDHIVCLLSDIFVQNYDGPSYFPNNLIGQRLYYGFRKILQVDRKALAPLFIAFEKGFLKRSDFEASVREVMRKHSSGSPHTRVPPESFYSNPWPECFCLNSSNRGIDQCPERGTGFQSYDKDEDVNFGGWNI